VLDYIRQALAHAVAERALSHQPIGRGALHQARGLEQVAQDVGRPVRGQGGEFRPPAGSKPKPLNVSVQISVRLFQRVSYGPSHCFYWWDGWPPNSRVKRLFVRRKYFLIQFEGPKQGLKRSGFLRTSLDAPGSKAWDHGGVIASQGRGLSSN